jgi:hypothetical protein
MKSTLQRFYNWWSMLAVITLFGALYLSLLYPWMNRWGVTDSEARMALPGDDAVSGLAITSTRGITINAPASEVWKWVVQLGQERAGFYSNDWLENLVLADIHNSDEIRAEWQPHQLGDKVLGAGGVVYGQSAFWPIRAYETGKVIYLWGQRWWKGLTLSIVIVILTFVLFNQPHTAFGIIFLFLMLGIGLVWQLSNKKYNMYSSGKL